MSLPDAEMPKRQPVGGNETLPEITAQNRGLYALVLYMLGLALLLLILGWVLIVVIGKPVPDGIPVVVATIVGALVGAIATDKKPG